MPTKPVLNINPTDTAKLSSADTATQDSLPAKSLFQNHLLPIKNKEPQLHITNTDFWVAGILLLIYILFVWLYVSNRKKLNQVIQTFYINRSGGQLTRDDLALGNRVSVFLSVFFIVNTTLFIRHLLPYYGFDFFNSNVSLLGVATAILIIITYGIKFLVIRLLGYVFKVQKEMSEYAMLVFLFCNTLGLFLLPVVIGLSFIDQVPPSVFIKIGLGIIAAFIGVRTVRGLFLGLNSSRISKFYLFMYLCTLEILPFIILAKLFMLEVK
ncbi:MAG: DUF4271 domain-containing protein [Bacteroidia bacterium]